MVRLAFGTYRWVHLTHYRSCPLHCWRTPGLHGRLVRSFWGQVTQLGHSVITATVLQRWLGPFSARSSAYVQLPQYQISSAFGPSPTCKPVPPSIRSSWRRLAKSPWTNEGYGQIGYSNTEAIQQSFFCACGWDARICHFLDWSKSLALSSFKPETFVWLAPQSLARSFLLPPFIDVVVSFDVWSLTLTRFARGKYRAAA